MDGIEYHKRIIMQPFIPLYVLPYSYVWLKSSRTCRIYIETGVLDSEYRRNLMPKQLAFFFENGEIPTVTVKNYWISNLERGEYLKIVPTEKDDLITNNFKHSCTNVGTILGSCLEKY